MTLVILLPAAGASSRMTGRDKLLEEVDGQPLMTRQATRALATGVPVHVTTRADRPARTAALDELAVVQIPVAEPGLGLSASIRAGVAALPGGVTALMVLLPDLPEIETVDMRAMIDAHANAPDRILRATTADGTPGHPTVFPRKYFAALARLTGDTGAKSLLRQEGFTPFPLPGRRAVTDLDTPEDWARWRADRG